MRIYVVPDLLHRPRLGPLQSMCGESCAVLASEEVAQLGGGHRSGIEVHLELVPSVVDLINATA